MRSRKDILERIEFLIPSHLDPLGVMVGLLVFFLDYRDAGRHLKKEVDREEWNQHKHPLTEARVYSLLRAGVRASWKAANRRQGIESNKGFMVLEVLCWLLGPKEYEWADSLFWTRGKMAHYGKPQLVAMHERFNLGPWQELDDGRWRNDEFGIDLDAATALRQWHTRWDRVQVGRNGGSRG